MADEYSKPPHNRKLPVPKEYVWETLTALNGAEFELFTLRKLIINIT